MAYQSLYRRYRPRRFDEVRGQEHVVRALRNAVRDDRVGHAYLFSGPRGTGKTTSARILAKVLNCTNPVDGEPCCACDSCKAVEAGTSYDVHELDAASNNGVDSMRDLIEKAALGTPGRHKVYILDEVHMLSKAAEAALLKTLEEPPPHVVFVLATTDPQKVSETIRSRSQQLHFRLLPADTLEAHVRWLAGDAGLAVDDAAVEAVVRMGGGSARDTISALEQVVAAGGVAPDAEPLDDLVEALIDTDPGRALTAAAAAVNAGRDARVLTETLLSQLRDGFLSLMAPALVRLPDRSAAQVADQGRRLGPAATVRAMEVLGDILVEMRHAPDPRVLLDVALVRLTSPAADTNTAALVARIERLERALSGAGPLPPMPAGGPGDGSPAGSAATAPSALASRAAAAGARAAAATPTAASLTTASPVAGSVAGSVAASAAAPAALDAAGAGSMASPEPAPIASNASAAPDASAAPTGARTATPAQTAPATAAPAAPAAPDATAAVATSATAGSSGTNDAAPRTRAQLGARAKAAPDPAPAARQPPDASATTRTASPAATTGPAAAGHAPDRDQLTLAWPDHILPKLKGRAKALYSAGRFLPSDAGTAVLAFPNAPHRDACEGSKPEVEQALAAHFGTRIALTLVVDGPAGGDTAAPPDRGDGRDGRGANTNPGAPDRPGGERQPVGRLSTPDPGPPEPDTASADGPDAIDEMDDIDLTQLVDAPSDPGPSAIDRVTQAFPGAKLLDDVGGV